MSDQVLIAIIGSAGTIFAALIAAAVAIYASRRQISKDITKLSGNLPSWKLLFEHDPNGNMIAGDIKDLTEAIGKAYPIKVKIYRENNRLEMMDAQWIYVENHTVHAANTDQISTTKDEGGNYSFISDTYHYYVIVSSNGRHHATRVFIDGRKSCPTDDKRRMAWFGLVPPSS